MKRAIGILPHVSIVMSGMMIVFFLIDRVNIAMGFMSNEFHKWLSFFLALFCMGYSVLLIAYLRYAERENEKRAVRDRRSARAGSAAVKPAGRMSNNR